MCALRRNMLRELGQEFQRVENLGIPLGPASQFVASRIRKHPTGVLLPPPVRGNGITRAAVHRSGWHETIHRQVDGESVDCIKWLQNESCRQGRRRGFWPNRSAHAENHRSEVVACPLVRTTLHRCSAAGRSGISESSIILGLSRESASVYSRSGRKLPTIRLDDRDYSLRSRVAGKAHERVALR